MTKSEIKLLARDLYLRSNKTQKQIAEQVGVSDRTIRYWIQQEEWDVIRYRMDNPPSTHTECISMQLTCLQKRILSRDSGIPTMQEAMLMHKLIMCMTRLNQMPALNHTVSAPSYLYTSPDEYDSIPPEDDTVSTAYSGQTANDGSQTAPGEEDLNDISSLPFPFRMILAKSQAQASPPSPSLPAVAGERESEGEVPLSQQEKSGNKAEEKPEAATPADVISNVERTCLPQAESPETTSQTVATSSTDAPAPQTPLSTQVSPAGGGRNVEATTKANATLSTVTDAPAVETPPLNEEPSTPYKHIGTRFIKPGPPKYGRDENGKYYRIWD